MLLSRASPVTSGRLTKVLSTAGFHWKCGSNIAVISMLTGIMQGASEWRITIVDFPDLLEDGDCVSVIVALLGPCP